MIYTIYDDIKFQISVQKAITYQGVLLFRKGDRMRR